MDLKKVIIFPVPAMGHLNTIFVVAKNLLKQIPNLKIIIYGSEYIKSKIEEIGCFYMEIENLDLEEAQRKLHKTGKVIDVMTETASMMLDCTEATALKISEYIEKENPDLVLYDNTASYGKWAAKIAKTKAKNLKTKFVVYHPQFVFQKDVFPNSAEKQELMKMNFCDKIKFGFFGLKLYMRTRSMKKKFGIPDDMDTDVMFTNTDLINIVFLFPGLQARSELMHENVKFVGACIDDGIHLENLNNVKDESIKEFLKMFAPRNPSSTSPGLNQNFLIYVSLGSMFTDNFDFYLKVIEAFNMFVTRSKSNNIFAIINVGKVCYSEFNNGNYTIPKAIKIVPYAPQLEVLKRASVFLTHCGMNSTSESIWFGVPMICSPVSVDQPLVANRVVNELGMGVLLNIHDFKVEDLTNSFHTIYTDDRFHKKAYEYAQVSQKYNGNQRATEIIKKYL